MNEKKKYESVYFFLKKIEKWKNWQKVGIKKEEKKHTNET